MSTPPSLDLPARLAPLDGSIAMRGTDVVSVAARPTVPLIQLRGLLLAPADDDVAVRRLVAATLLRHPGALAALDAVDATAEVSDRTDGVLLQVSAGPGPLERLVAVMHSLLRPAGMCDAEVIAAEAARLASEDVVTANRPDESARRAALRALHGEASRYAESMAASRPVAAEELSGWLARSGAIVLSAAGVLDTRQVTGWGDAGTPGPIAPSPAAVTSSAGWSMVDRPGAAQTVLRAVASLPGHGAATRPAAEVAEHLLGSGRKSALVRELRDRRGFGYHPGSHIVDRVATSYVLVEVDVATEVTGVALAVVDDVLRGMVEQAPDDGQLDAARRGVVGELARTTDGQGTLADLLLDLAVAGFGPDALVAHAGAVADLGAAEVQSAAARIAAGMHCVALADVTAIRDQQLPPSWS